MANSTHKVEVFRIREGDLTKHPNADSLSLLKVFDGYQAVVRTSDYKVGDLVCYVPPDNVLPDEPQYAFLKDLRIKACKLRGAVSQGLVLPAPEGSAVGDDVAEILKVTHYVPEIKMGGDGEFIAPPPFAGETYDIDSWFRYNSLLPEGTPCEFTEKIDGANTRVSFQDGALWAGSRSHFRKEDPNGMFWRSMHENPWLQILCKQNPDCMIYGETYGRVQDLRYGAQSNQVFFRVFDIMTPKGYMNHAEKIAAIKAACEAEPVAIPTPWENCHVPILFIGPYTKEKVVELMDGPSTVPGADHEREGVVIKPLVEMWCPEIGRLVLKAVGPEHLGKDKKKK